MSDPIERQIAIDAVQGIKRLATLPDNDAVVRMSAVEHVLFNLPSAQPDLQQICNKLATDCKWKKNIILEIDKTIEEVKHNGKYHAKFVKENGELVIFGLEIAKHIIEKGEEDGQTD